MRTTIRAAGSMGAAGRVAAVVSAAALILSCLDPIGFNTPGNRAEDAFDPATQGHVIVWNMTGTAGRPGGREVTARLTPSGGGAAVAVVNDQGDLAIAPAAKSGSRALDQGVYTAVFTPLTAEGADSAGETVSLDVYVPPESFTGATKYLYYYSLTPAGLCDAAESPDAALAQIRLLKTLAGLMSGGEAAADTEAIAAAVGDLAEAAGSDAAAAALAAYLAQAAAAAGAISGADANAAAKALREALIDMVDANTWTEYLADALVDGLAALVASQGAGTQDLIAALVEAVTNGADTTTGGLGDLADVLADVGTSLTDHLAVLEDELERARDQSAEAAPGGITVWNDTTDGTVITALSWKGSSEVSSAWTVPVPMGVAGGNAYAIAGLRAGAYYDINVWTGGLDTNGPAYGFTNILARVDTAGEARLTKAAPLTALARVTVVNLTGEDVSISGGGEIAAAKAGGETELAVEPGTARVEARSAGGEVLAAWESSVAAGSVTRLWLYQTGAAAWALTDDPDWDALYTPGGDTGYGLVITRNMTESLMTTVSGSVTASAAPGTPAVLALPRGLASVTAAGSGGSASLTVTVDPAAPVNLYYYKTANGMCVLGTEPPSDPVPEPARGVVVVRNLTGSLMTVTATSGAGPVTAEPNQTAGVTVDPGLVTVTANTGTPAEAAWPGTVGEAVTVYLYYYQDDGGHYCLGVDPPSSGYAPIDTAVVVTHNLTDSGMTVTIDGAPATATAMATATADAVLTVDTGATGTRLVTVTAVGAGNAATAEVTVTSGGRVDLFFYLDTGSTYALDKTPNVYHGSAVILRNWTETWAEVTVTLAGGAPFSLAAAADAEPDGAASAAASASAKVPAGPVTVTVTGLQPVWASESARWASGDLPLPCALPAAVSYNLPADAVVRVHLYRDAGGVLRLAPDASPDAPADLFPGGTALLVIKPAAGAALTARNVNVQVDGPTNYLVAATTDWDTPEATPLTRPIAPGYYYKVLMEAPAVISSGRFYVAAADLFKRVVVDSSGGVTVFGDPEP